MKKRLSRLTLSNIIECGLFVGTTMIWTDAFLRWEALTRKDMFGLVMISVVFLALWMATDRFVPESINDTTGEEDS